MPSLYAENFDREIACSEAEWLACLPQAIGSHPFRLVAQAATVNIGTGHLALSWHVSKYQTHGPRTPAPLLVSFRHSGLTEAQRYLFMRHFEAYLPKHPVPPPSGGWLMNMKMPSSPRVASAVSY